MTKEEKRIQKYIDKKRAQGVKIRVSHNTNSFDDEGFDETNISIKLSNKYDAFKVADKIRQRLDLQCDSGCGLGWRDLQLCRLLPGLK